MANMKTIMPALQRAKAPAAQTAGVTAGAGLSFVSVSLPKQRRETRIEKNMAPEEIAREIAAWIREE
jgi:electron transfer flavoprotein beta subunit